MRIIIVVAAIVLCAASAAHKVATPPPDQPAPAYGAPPPPPPPPPPQQQNYCYQYTPRGGGKIESYCVGSFGACTKAHDATSHSDKYVTVSDCTSR